MGLELPSHTACLRLHMNRGFDIGEPQFASGRNRNSLVNSGSIGNDGEGVMAQEHNRVGVYSCAFSHNMHGRADKGPGTFGETGWHGSWNMQRNSASFSCAQLVPWWRGVLWSW